MSVSIVILTKMMYGKDKNIGIFTEVNFYEVF